MGFLSRQRQPSEKWKCYCELTSSKPHLSLLSLSLVNKFCTIRSGLLGKNQYPEEATRQITRFPITFRIFFTPPPPFPPPLPNPNNQEAYRSNHSSLHPHRQKGDLSQLSAEGHFLKGSSATLGLNKVKDSCEKIQNYGQHKDETGTNDEPDDAKCLGRIKKTLDVVRVEYAEVEKVLRRFYHEHV